MMIQLGNVGRDAPGLVRETRRSVSRANKNEVGTQRRNRSNKNNNAHRSRRAVGRPAYGRAS
jgi:hypothetical protein